jgi:hypothetical protein
MFSRWIETVHKMIDESGLRSIDLVVQYINHASEELPDNETLRFLEAEAGPVLMMLEG